MAYVPIHQFTKADSADLYRLMLYYNERAPYAIGVLDMKDAIGRDIEWILDAVDHLYRKGLIK